MADPFYVFAAKLQLTFDKRVPFGFANGITLFIGRCARFVP